MDIISPKPIGYGRTRESFKSRTGVTFDPIAAAESSVQATLNAMLHPHRVNRISQHHALGKSDLSFSKVLDMMFDQSFNAQGKSYAASLQRMTDQLFLDQLMSLSLDERLMSENQAVCLFALSEIQAKLKNKSADSEEGKAHLMLAQNKIQKFVDDPTEWKKAPTLQMPAGSPIGCGHSFHN